MTVKVKLPRHRRQARGQATRGGWCPRGRCPGDSASRGERGWLPPGDQVVIAGVAHPDRDGVALTRDHALRDGLADEGGVGERFGELERDVSRVVPCGHDLDGRRRRHEVPTVGVRIELPDPAHLEGVRERGVGAANALAVDGHLAVDYGARRVPGADRDLSGHAQQDGQPRRVRHRQGRRQPAHLVRNADVADQILDQMVTRTWLPRRPTNILAAWAIRRPSASSGARSSPSASRVKLPPPPPCGVARRRRVGSPRRTPPCEPAGDPRPRGRAGDRLGECDDGLRVGPGSLQPEVRAPDARRLFQPRVRAQGDLDARRPVGQHYGLGRSAKGIRSSSRLSQCIAIHRPPRLTIRSRVTGSNSDGGRFCSHHVAEPPCHGNLPTPGRRVGPPRRPRLRPGRQRGPGHRPCWPVRPDSTGCASRRRHRPRGG